MAQSPSSNSVGAFTRDAAFDVASGYFIEPKIKAILISTVEAFMPATKKSVFIHPDIFFKDWTVGNFRSGRLFKTRLERHLRMVNSDASGEEDADLISSEILDAICEEFVELAAQERLTAEAVDKRRNGAASSGTQGGGASSEPLRVPEVSRSSIKVHQSIPVWSGKDVDLDGHIRLVDSILDVAKETDPQTKKFHLRHSLPAPLQEQIMSTWPEDRVSEGATYEKFKARLQKEKGIPLRKHIDIITRAVLDEPTYKEQPGEGLRSYLDRHVQGFAKLSMLTEGKLDFTVINDGSTASFTLRNGLRDQVYWASVVSEELSYKDLLAKLYRIAEAEREHRPRPRTTPPVAYYNGGALGSSKGKGSGRDSGSGKEGKSGHRGGNSAEGSIRVGGAQPTVFPRGPKGAEGPKNVAAKHSITKVCFRCHKPGHFIAQCRAPKPEGERAPGPRSPRFILRRATHLRLCWWGMWYTTTRDGMPWPPPSSRSSILAPQSIVCQGVGSVPKAWIATSDSLSLRRSARVMGKPLHFPC
jgi:hypothetical protein